MHLMFFKKDAPTIILSSASVSIKETPPLQNQYMLTSIAKINISVKQHQQHLTLLANFVTYTHYR